MTTRPPTTRLATVALLATLGVTAACGSDSDDTAADLPTLDGSTDDAAETDTETNAGTENETDTDAGSDDGDGGDESGEVDPDLAMAEFEQCMVDQGVEIEIATAESGGGANIEQSVELDASEDPETAFADVDAAMEVCDPILDDAFGSFEMSPEQEAEMADQMLEMQRCMAEQGYDLDIDGGSFMFEETGEASFEEFDAAMNDCVPELELPEGQE